jgi:cob(I)alamin adenosyltransferase
MEKHLIEVICGSGKGKSALAFGRTMQVTAKGKSVIIIQFLKGNEQKAYGFLEELENLDIKFFRFEKQETEYVKLDEETQKEEKINILNGINFARKVIVTRECEFLVLDEFLGLIDMGIISQETVTEMLTQKDDSMGIILTGQTMPEWLSDYVDTVTTLITTPGRLGEG